MQIYIASTCYVIKKIRCYFIINKLFKNYPIIIISGKTNNIS